MNDLHVFTTQSAKKIFQAAGQDGQDHCLSAHWRFFYDKDPAIGLPLSREEASRPYTYETFDEMAKRFAGWFIENEKETDFFYASFTSKLVHLFKYLDRPIHCQLSFRFDDNHELFPSDAIALRDLLIGLTQAGRLTLSANNRYDAMYMYYYTGIQPIYIPSTGSYIDKSYNPQSDLVLIGPGRHYTYGTFLMDQIAEQSRARFGLNVQTVAAAYPDGHSWEKLCECRAMVVIPYAVSSGSFFEYLSMGIPLFFPTIRLLTEWHCSNYLLVERKPSLKPMRASRMAAAVSTMPDPQNDFDRDAVRFWLQYSDWYHWDGVRLFDSIDELGEMLSHFNNFQHSRKQKIQSHRDLENATRVWKSMLS